MPARNVYNYAVIRIVPRIEREEFINAGVILFARTRRFLGVRMQLDRARLLALDPAADVAEVERHLDLIRRIACGAADAGPIGRLDRPERFRWLVSPRSTVVQVSPVHAGLCEDPQAALDDLFDKMVAQQ